jgi:hypothetical protein
VVILTMALLVAGTSSAFATTPEPGVQSVATGLGTPVDRAGAVEPARASGAAPARDGETIIPLLMVCPPPLLAIGLDGVDGKRDNH